MAVFGADDPPELSMYEKLMERTIRERDKVLMKDMRYNAPGAKKRAAEKETMGRRKRKKVVEP